MKTLLKTLAITAIIATAATAQGTTTISGIEVVLVKAGSFTMGGADFGNDVARQVKLTEDFYIGKYPITEAQYQAITGKPILRAHNHPVVNVGWDQAVAFAATLGGHLPTEAQWEFAARGGNQSKGFIYSGNNNIGEVAWHSGNSNNSTQPVGRKDYNELGIYDMSGNVWEWTNDLWGIYSTAAVENPTGASVGDHRVIRGGSFVSNASDCRVGSRERGTTLSFGNHSTGFRVAFNPKNIRTIKFNSNGGSGFVDMSVSIGASILKPCDPVKTDHRFIAWYKDANFENIWDFANDKIEDNTTLYAKWEINVMVSEIMEAYAYNSEQIKPTPKVQLRRNNAVLQNGIIYDYTLSYGENINAGNGSVRIRGTEKYPFLDTTIIFEINKRTITPVVSVENIVIGANPQPALSGNFCNGNVEFLFSTSENGTYTPMFTANNTGTFWVRANVIETPNCRAAQSAAVSFQVLPATEIRVVWGEQREFVYNKMVQHPTWHLEPADLINRNHLIMVNGNNVSAGKYEGVNAPEIQIRDEHRHLYTNFRLVGASVEYEIKKRPLNIVMRDQNGNRRDTITTEERIRISGDLFDYIENILGFNNFATDTINNRTDDEGVLLGRPKFSILNNNSQHSLRALRNSTGSLERNIPLEIGERFIVSVIPEDIKADNYFVLERDISIEIGERFITLTTDPRENPTSIGNPRKSNKRYGIRFAENIVSENAEISVVLPNNERATEMKVVIYDMTGNVVFAIETRHALSLQWDLRNPAGRFVANGTYLVIAEVKDRNGKMYQYSARLGVKR